VTGRLSSGSGSGSRSSSLTQSGPPASAKQVAYLLSLVQRAGFLGFSDARRPFGLTQRQARGKFTSREASELIDALLETERSGVEPDDRAASVADAQRTKAEERAEARRAEQLAHVVRGMPAELLADELSTRGWTVHPPEEPPTRSARVRP
jgi:hypothetical protein